MGDFSELFFNFNSFNSLNEWKVGRMGGKWILATHKVAPQKAFSVPREPMEGKWEKEGISHG